MARFDPKTRLSYELLGQLYNQEHLSIEEIAGQLGWGATTVSRALHRHGIPIRTKHDYRIEIPRDELARLYNEEASTLEEIGKQFHCSGKTIARRLQEFSIPIRPVGPVSAHIVPSDVLAAWSPDLAYATGLLAADGTLDNDRVRVEFISTDKDLIEAYCRALCLDNIHVMFTPQQARKSWYKVKLNDRAFRSFLEDVGLVPSKSKSLGPLQIPDHVFRDFLRGVLDGDGSWFITKSWSGRYQYLCVELCSASQRFGEWIRKQVEQLTGLQGRLDRNSTGRAYKLVYMGQKALALGRWVYYSPGVLSLPRKRRIWEQMQNREVSRRTR